MRGGNNQTQLCGIEQHLPKLLEICQTTNSALVDPYIEALHEKICAHCEFHESRDCPCPLDYLLALAVEAIEKAQRRRAHAART